MGCKSKIAKMNRTQDIHLKAIELFKQHGLEGWSFKFDRAIKRAGSCHFGKKVITLSVHMIMRADISLEQIDNILLHEIAHALVGHQHGHNNVWRSKAMEIGCDGARCHSLVFTPPPRFRLECPCGACNVTRMRVKAKTWERKICSKCSAPIIVSRL